MFSIKQDECWVHWCRKCSFHGLTSLTAQSGWVLSDIITHIIITIITISQCSFSSNKCEFVADKQNHYHSHKTAHIYIYICNKNQQNHIQSCITVENLDMILLIILSQVHLSGITGLMSSLCSIATNILGLCLINTDFILIR